jgi:hypothetical protein
MVKFLFRNILFSNTFNNRSLPAPARLRANFLHTSWAGLLIE